MQWPDYRSADITQRLATHCRKGEIRYRFVTAESLGMLGGSKYFPDRYALARDISSCSPPGFIYADGAPADPGADMVIVTAHGGPDDAAQLWNLRRRVDKGTILAIWLWDNHWGYTQNLHAVLAADFVFTSHSYAAGYLHTPASLVAANVPSCSAQWTYDEASRFFTARQGMERRHKLLVNYLIHGEASPMRKRVLEEYRAGLAEADVSLMTPKESSRYFGLTAAEKFAEWAAYKATVIVPVGADLSTRVFDSLLAGQIPIIPTYITDFDDVVPVAIQKDLGVVRTDSLELPDIRNAAALALDRYDEMGNAGAAARHRYVLEYHLLRNRVADILDTLWRLGSEQHLIEFADAYYGPALYRRLPDSDGRD